MARATTALLAVLCLAVGASARLAPEEAVFGRALLQDCSRIPNCNTCTNRREGGSTVLRCTACIATYTTNADGSACDCSAGYTRSSTSGTCAACGQGSYCEGGASGGNTECGAGFTTAIDTATRQEQCVSLPGYGVSSDGNNATACSIGSFSAGGTRSPCRPCGSGLTTASTGSNSTADCKAPDGYYFDKNAAKPCPRGTYKTGLDRAATCTSCAAGITTAASASTVVADCNLAKKGYAASAPNTAAKCPVNKYQPINGEAIGNPCTDCPTGMVTKAEGSATKTACVAPKGWGYNSGSDIAEVCPIGQYKAGANRRACVSCGTGFSTTGTGKTSFADCFIDQGMGTTKSGNAYTAATCDVGSYGASARTFGVRSLPCTPCPTGMSTVGQGSSRPEDCKTVAGYGYDQATQTAQKCPVGTFSVGGDRNECVACGEGYTTADVASTSADACVIAPGYGFTAAGKDPEPCPKGYFGVGMGNETTCTQCSGQTTTAKDSLATAQTECTLCNAGYGVANVCNSCAASSYNTGDSADCATCPTDTTSPITSTSAEDCVATWTSLNPSLDTINITGVTTGVDTSTKSQADCKAACEGDATCMFYTWVQTNTVCKQVKQQSGSNNIMFKNAATKYTVWSWGSDPIGTALTSAAATAAGNAAACVAACDAADSCIAAIFGGSTCTLIAGTTDPDVKACQWRAIGTKMNIAPLA